MEIAFACPPPPHPPMEAFQADLKYLHILQVCVFWQEGVGQPSDEQSLSSRHVVFFLSCMLFGTGGRINQAPCSNQSHLYHPANK